MRLQDVMSTNVTTVGPSVLVGEARSLMRLRGIHHLVVRDGRRIVGLVSDRDLGGGRSGRDDSVDTLPVGEVMTAAVVTAKPETTVRQAANLMRGRSVGCLPVIEDGEAVGIVTTTDLLGLLGRGREKPIQESTPWTLRARGPRKARPQLRHGRTG